MKADVLTGDFAAGLEAKIREAVPRAMPADLRGLITAWRTEYGDEYVRREASRALMWLDENGKNYTDMARFIGNWLRNGAKAKDTVALGGRSPRGERGLKEMTPLTWTH